LNFKDALYLIELIQDALPAVVSLLRSFQFSLTDEETVKL